MARMLLHLGPFSGKFETFIKLFQMIFLGLLTTCSTKELTTTSSPFHELERDYLLLNRFIFVLT